MTFAAMPLREGALPAWLRDKKNSSFLRGRVEQLSVGCSFWRLPLVHPANANRTVGLLVNISVDEFLIYGCINFSSVNL